MSIPPSKIDAKLRSTFDSRSIDESPSPRGSLDLDGRKFSISVMNFDGKQPYEPPSPPSDDNELLIDLNNNLDKEELPHAPRPYEPNQLRGWVVQQPSPHLGEVTPPAPGRGAGLRAAHNAAQVGGGALVVGAVGATATGVSIAAGALKGAAVGAAFGSIVPGIGTGVGAVVGGLIGSAVALGIGGAIAGAIGSGIKTWWKNKQVASVDQPNVPAQQPMPRQQNDNDVGNRLYYGDNNHIDPMPSPRINIDNNWNDGNLDTLRIDEDDQFFEAGLDGDKEINDRLDELQKQMDEFDEEDLKVKSKEREFNKIQEKHSNLSSLRDGRDLERARDDQFGLAYKEHIATRLEIGGNQNPLLNDENPLIEEDAKAVQWNPIPDVTPPSVQDAQQNEQNIEAEFSKADWKAQQTFHKYRKSVPYRNMVPVPNENGKGSQRVNFGFSAHVSGQMVNTLHEAYEDAWARQNRPQGGKLAITAAESELLGIGKEQDASLANCLAGEEQILGQELLTAAKHLRDGNTDPMFPPVLPLKQRRPDIARQFLSDCNKQSRALYLLQKAADADFDLNRMSPLTRRYFLRNPNDAQSGPNQTLQTLRQAAQPNANQLMLNPELAELQNATPNLKDQITAAQIHNAILSGIYSGIAKRHGARNNFMAPYHSLKPSQKKRWASFMTRLNTGYKSNQKGIRGGNGYEYDGIPRSGLFDLRNDLNRDHLDLFMHEMQKDFPTQINDNMRFGHAGSPGAERYDPLFILKNFQLDDF